MEAVLLPVGSDAYAVTMPWMSEVLPTPSATRLVTGPAVVLGLINLRGDIVPLLDTARLLGVGTSGEAAYAAVVRSPLGLVALAATGLPERVSLDGPAGSSTLRGTAGVFWVQGRAAVLLDLVVLLSFEHVGGQGAVKGLAGAH